MISDTLHDAIVEIRRYRTCPVFAHAYPEHWPEMDACLAMMDAMRKRLDQMPGARDG